MAGVESKSGPPAKASTGRTPLKVAGPATARDSEVLTVPALEFVGLLHARFDSDRRRLLAERGAFRETIRAGGSPEFPAETSRIRESEWKVPPAPADLADRRVEITGPVDRKMVINALNSGACVYMADFEDAHSPTWTATVHGQANLRDAVRRAVDFVSPEGKEYRLGPRTATLMMRPRGWHLDERHVRVDGHDASASLVDFGLYFFHNARELVARGSGPYFYLPKMEHYREATLWNEVFRFSEEHVGLPLGTIRATALIETLPAAFQMDEILYALREHSVGLNCGRWDYLFSFMKQFRDPPDFLVPDRSVLTMSTPFLTAYSRLLVQTCHRRGAHAMGGMAAQIPIRDDPEANAAALALVRQDKEREVRAGHDGTWVAHPGLVPIAREVFDRGMPMPNQIGLAQNDPPVRPSELLSIPGGNVTRDGVRRNVRVSLRYLEAWLRGVGCVPIDHLMEDAATVEIARTQLWVWLHHHAHEAAGGAVDERMFRELLEIERGALLAERDRTGGSPTLARAEQLLVEAVTSSDLKEFITVEAYRELPEPEGDPR
jgi:malate synthase